MNDLKKTEAAIAVDRLILHIEEQQKERDSDPSYSPSRDQKQVRAKILQDIALALDTTAQELQVRLGVNPSTWDRWKNMISIPSPSYLESLKRYSKEKNRDEIKLENKDFGTPLQLLSGSPLTFGRIRLALSLYEWDNAVFHFDPPFCDDKMVVDIATLALKGCRIIYLTSDIENWPKKLIAIMALALGSKLTAKALCQICLIKTLPTNTEGPKSYGVLNYEANEHNLSVGYVWNLSDKGEQPSNTEDGAYTAYPANDDRFIELRLKYHSEINQAFEAINERLSFSEDHVAELDRESSSLSVLIPIISGDEVDLETAKIDISKRSQLESIQGTLA